MKALSRAPTCNKSIRYFINSFFIFEMKIISMLIAIIIISTYLMFSKMNNKRKSLKWILLFHLTSPSDMEDTNMYRFLTGRFQLASA